MSLVSLTWRDHDLNNSIDWFETQSSRGENQNQPSSSGYNPGGPVGGAPNVAGGPADYAVPPESSSNILSASLDPNEQGNAGYAYPPMVGAAHNGAGGGTY